MKAVYIYQEIEGIVEYAHPKLQTEIAKLTLENFIDSIKENYDFGKVLVYHGILSDNEFPHPFDCLNIREYRDFFKNSKDAVVDLNMVEKEVHALSQQFKDELKFHKDNVFLPELEKMNDIEDCEALTKKYHYKTPNTPEEIQESVKKAKELISSINEEKDFYFGRYGGSRSQLINCLEIIDDCHNRSLIKEIERNRDLFKKGKIDEIKERINSCYDDWIRKNVASLYQKCGDAEFYGAGFWIARLVCDDRKNESFEKFMTFLERRRDYALIDLKNL